MLVFETNVVGWAGVEPVVVQRKDGLESAHVGVMVKANVQAYNHLGTLVQCTHCYSLVFPHSYCCWRQVLTTSLQRQSLNQHPKIHRMPDYIVPT